MLPLININRNLRSLKRYREVLGVLVTHGFDQVVEQLNLDYYLEIGRQLVSRNPEKKQLERLPAPVRLRMAMEKLGPTFIKLGQTLSSRPDILPAAYLAELNKLQDSVQPISHSEIKRHIEKELGAPIDTLFAKFTTQPVAAASIAQVHKGWLHDGTTVAIKVRRPGIEKIIETDIDILNGLAALLEKHGFFEEICSPIEIVQEFNRTIYREIDFTKEGHTFGRFRANFEHNTSVYIPQVFWEFSNESILTMEFIDGIKISETHDLESAGYDLKQIAKTGAQSFLEQVLTHGLFHGDPHPGNILVLPKNTICLLDLGMIGYLSEDLKLQLANLILGLYKRDIDLLISVMLSARERSKEINIAALKRDLSEFIDDYYQIPLERINSLKLINEFIVMMKKHHIKFPSDLLLLAKALITIEGIGRQLDPSFNLIEQIQPAVTELLKQRLSGASIQKELTQTLRAYSEVAKTLPRDIKELMYRINNNNFKIDLEHRGLDKLITDLDKSSNRLSFSFLIGSLIIGSSLIMQTESGPQIFGIPALGLLGYTIAAGLGLWLAIGILRSGRL
ncbi:MAG: ubiquinone biosynthesis protein UbiB [Desulfobacteraceae bacterium 4572_35.2]|nr:MAG: ubiquinone biosynthesis protein UbiB [Desulfobacteraceae bacterium 4572_35.2]